MSLTSTPLASDSFNYVADPLPGRRGQRFLAARPYRLSTGYCEGTFSICFQVIHGREPSS